jgi:hypothetical protein
MIKHLYIFSSRFVENLAYNFQDSIKHKIPCTVLLRQITIEDIKKLQKDEYFYLFSPQSTLSKSAITYLPKNSYFIHQTEDISYYPRANRFHNNKMMFHVINNALHVFDYSKNNLLMYSKKYEKQPLYFPYIFNNNQEAQEEKSIDILFYGTMNQRRYIILEVLKQLLPDLKIVIKDKTFGEDLKTLIKKSKIILNIHINEYATLEIGRLYEAMPYNVHIISERTNELQLMNEYQYIHFINELIDYKEKTEINIEKQSFDQLISIINKCLTTMPPKYVINNNYVEQYFLKN